MFGRLPLCHLDPDTVVAQGTAIQAGLKENNKALDDFVVTDVSPYSLGVAVYTDTPAGKPGICHFDPIIERNSVIPTSRSKIYYPLKNNQEKIAFRIYQGENYFIEKNVFLGKLTIQLPPNLKSKGVEVRFTYDINGLLEIEATILETKTTERMVIEGNPGVLTKEQIAERLLILEKIKIHPRENTENILIISQAEKLYADLNGEEREYLGYVIKEFIKALEAQNTQLITKIREYLEKLISSSQFEIIE